MNELSQDQALIQDFLTESDELVQQMEQDLLALETAHDAESLHRIFRAMHTIKGTSSFLGFDQLVGLTHKAEDLLNDLRKSQQPAGDVVLDLLLRVADQVRRLLAVIRNGTQELCPIEPLVTELLRARENFSGQISAQIAGGERAVDSPVDATAATAVHASEAATVDAVAVSPQVSEAQVSTTMRVDVRKLDYLVNLVGELVLERNRLSQLGRDLNAGRTSRELMQESITQLTARLSFITDELQIASLSTRMIPIETLFRKLPRMVRDLAQALGKKVEIEVSGQETEIDKAMIEQISDPLVHLIRNCLDHGIETPEKREQSGKTPIGHIRVDARQEGDQIVVAIADDGAGINPDRVLAKAIDKGLLTPERARTITQREILDLIFLPGFSTAERVSNISGRGVGMDVVRTNIKKLNGGVEIESKHGEGTCVTLNVPLTMAILPVLMVEVSGEIYALPLRSVIETLRIQPRDIHQVEGREALCLRNTTVPLVRLADRFGLATGNHDSEIRRAVILALGDLKFALLVDHLIGQESTVIKPLGSLAHNCPAIAGATISGDGRVRLVIDPAELIRASSY